MKEWQLADFATAPGGAEEAPSTVIRSEDQLREELSGRRGRRPAMVALISPEGMRLDIGIGGPWAGVQWTEPPYSRNLKLAVATGPHPATAVDFACEGASSGFRPEYLLPAAEAVEIAAYFFAHQRLPEWVAWAAWNPKTNRMEAAPASASPSAFPAGDAAAPAPPPAKPS